MLPQKLAFVDVETTGGKATTDRIIEIGILRVDGTDVETYQTLLNPGGPLPAFIETLTHISDADLENAPAFSTVARDIAELLADCVFVAHNARFDYAFLKNEFKREGLPFCPKQLCTVKLARHLFPDMRHHNLDSIIERFGFQCENRHRAFDDAKVLWDFYQKVQASMDELLFQKSLDVVMKTPALPVHIPKQDIDNLTEGCGVYIFYGDTDLPLYVGKSINVKDRVMSHFASDHAFTKEMNLAQQVKRIEVIPTPGELGALLRESALVKSLQPIYNRRLRQVKKFVCLVKDLSEKGYDTVKIEQVTAETMPQSDTILGFFKSMKQVKGYLDQVAQEHNLCKKLLGLEKTTQSCFGYRLDKCKGACVGKEIPVAYNLRFIETFIKTKLKRWPFNGPIAIVEKDPVENQAEAIVVDQWCCLRHIPLESGQVESSEMIIQSATEEDTPLFDLDAYKIILSYLAQDKNLKNVHTAPNAVSEAYQPQWL